MKVLSLLELVRKFKLSKRCQKEIEKLYVFGVFLGTLMGFAMGLAFPVNDFVHDVTVGFLFLMNMTNAFLMRLDVFSFAIGMFASGALFIIQHWEAHHKYPCCKKHNLECVYQN